MRRVIKNTTIKNRTFDSGTYVIKIYERKKLTLTIRNCDIITKEGCKPLIYILWTSKRRKKLKGVNR